MEINELDIWNREVEIREEREWRWCSEEGKDNKKKGKKRTKEVATARRTDLCKEENGINRCCCILLPSGRAVLPVTLSWISLLFGDQNRWRNWPYLTACRLSCSLTSFTVVSEKLPLNLGVLFRLLALNRCCTRKLELLYRRPVKFKRCRWDETESN
jgi:hypothetical protein